MPVRHMALHRMIAHLVHEKHELKHARGAKWNPNFEDFAVVRLGRTLDADVARSFAHYARTRNAVFRAARVRDRRRSGIPMRDTPYLQMRRDGYRAKKRAVERMWAEQERRRALNELTALDQELGLQ